LHRSKSKNTSRISFNDEVYGSVAKIADTVKDDYRMTFHTSPETLHMLNTNGFAEGVAGQNGTQGADKAVFYFVVTLQSAPSEQPE
jgi:hypothetical protein